jgi:hypothetical protein
MGVPLCTASTRPRKREVSRSKTWHRFLHPQLTMITSIFRAEERALVMSCLDEWEQLRGVGKERDANGELYSSKDRLVDKVIQDIFAKFPERDSAKQPWSKLAFTHDERDSLHTVSLVRTRMILVNTLCTRGSSVYSTTVCPKGNRQGKPDVALVIDSSLWQRSSSSDTWSGS